MEKFLTPNSHFQNYNETIIHSSSDDRSHQHSAKNTARLSNNTYTDRINNKPPAKNVYANNYIGVPRTQAYSWSMNKGEVANDNNHASNKFVERVIDKDEIRKIRKMNSDLNTKLNFMDKKEILLVDIESKSKPSHLKNNTNNTFNDTDSKKASMYQPQKKQNSDVTLFNRYKNIVLAKK